MVAAPALTAAVKFLGAAAGALLAVGVVAAGSRPVGGPATTAAGFELLVPVGVTVAWAAGRPVRGAVAGGTAGAGAVAEGAGVSTGASLVPLGAG